MTRNFMSLIGAKWAEGKFVCVGLDTDPSKVPAGHIEGSKYLAGAQLMWAFNKEIVLATRDLVCAYKPNVAFYEKLGEYGWKALSDTVALINREAPGVPVIFDGKRGDIGNTNEGYVAGGLHTLQADAITINPYLGLKDGLQPFLDQKDKGIIVLCRTSNKGAKEFQERHVLVKDDELKVPGVSLLAVGGFENPAAYAAPLYQLVAWQVSRLWNQNGNCALVVGATCSEELAQVRLIAGDMPILIPGIGAQGGDLEKTVQAGKNSSGQGMIINLSRSVLYASKEADFAQAARKEVQRVNGLITQILKGSDT